MAEGKNQQRTKLSLDGNVPKSFPNFLRPFDALCDPEGARIVNTATGEATVAGVVGPSPSTLFSAIGSLFIWVIFIGWALMIIDAYQRDPPIIYEKTLDTPRDFEAPMPDFAMTLSLEPRDFYVASQIRQIKAARGSSRTWKEAEWEAKDEWKLLSEDQQNFYKAVDDRTLEYLWPVFRWEKIMTADGLEVMDQDKSLLGPEDGLSFGDECGLNTNYNLDYGRWPVFCFLNSKLPPEKQRRLSGRDFGDPRWNYLDVRIVRCTNMSAAEMEWEKRYTNVSAPFPWSGNCAPYGDIDELVDAGNGLGVQLFFRLPSEPDWKKSRWNRHAGQPADNSMVQGWTSYVYQRMSSSSAMNCRLYLKYTEAEVNSPLGFGYDDTYTYYKWIDFDRSECFRDYADDARFKEFRTLYRWDKSGHAMGENRTRFFDIDVRMHNKRRSLLVRRQNAREVLSEISGSWEISFSFGWLIVVVINHAIKAASACPRSREEAVKVWTQAYGRGAPKVAAADAAPAPAPATEVPAPAVEAAAPAAEASVRNLLSVRSRSSSRLVVPESPAPPLDPRKFAELMERVKELAERVEELENRRPESHK